MVRGQWANLSRTPGLHPYSFSKYILGFLMTIESQDLGLTSHPKDGAFYNIMSLYVNVSLKGTDCPQKRVFDILFNLTYNT